MCYKFTPGPCPNNHLTEPGRDKRLEFVAIVKERALSNTYMPASKIVDDMLMNTLPDAIATAIGKPQSLQRVADRAWEDPASPRFKVILSVDNIPSDFLFGNINVVAAQHLVFATAAQLELST